MKGICSPCKKSEHYKCINCECTCQRYEDTVKPRDEPTRLSDPANDEFFEELNKRYRELHS